MKRIRCVIKSLALVLTVTCAAVLSLVTVASANLPDTFTVVEGSALTIESDLPIQAVYRDTLRSGTLQNKSLSGDGYQADLRLFGLFPIKSAEVRVVDELYVLPSGESFGVKLFTSGVLVVGLCSVEGVEGSCSPAEAAGIQLNDNILTVDGVEIYSNEALARLIAASEGRALEIRLIRDGVEQTLMLRPVRCKDGTCKAGMWVRDSSAGIGTMTFYSPATGIAAGLGHGICDVDTGDLLPLSSGEMVGSNIYDIERSVSGSPGELKGRLTSTSIGELLLNSENGVYGRYVGELPADRLIPVAMRQEVTEGAAEIITTLDGGAPRRFGCQIERVYLDSAHQTRNMVICITDGDLIDRCGGIVQGMSGSPLIQNGKLIGAVTHVLVDDPTKGYAIFAENMLETSQSVAEDNKLKDAS